MRTLINTLKRISKTRSRCCANNPNKDLVITELYLVEEFSITSTLNTECTHRVFNKFVLCYLPLLCTFNNIYIHHCYISVYKNITLQYYR